MNRILVIGISGFLGSTIARHLTHAYSAVEAKGLSRKPSRPPQTRGMIECVQGDITDPGSLVGLFKGIHTVIHVASKVRGSDARELQTTNVAGTKIILDACVREGVRRIMYVSNAALYGMEVAHDAVEHEPMQLPATPVSLSRYEAERHLLSYHRAKTIEVLVLRPLFVYGRGDEFFIPPLLRALRRIPFLINGGRAKVSVISVDDVADVILELSQMHWPESEFPVYHLNDGYPIAFKEIVTTLHAWFPIRLTGMSVPYNLASLGMSIAGSKDKIFIGKNAGGEQRTISNAEFLHRIHLVSFDHSYSNARLMKLLSGKKFHGFEEKFQEYVDYYQTLPFRN